MKLKRSAAARFCAAVILISALISLLSCDNYDETVITDVGEYDELWELPELRIVERPAVFPETLEGMNVEKFSGTHTTYLPLGTGWQVELRAAFDEDGIKDEEARLEKICAGSPVCGESDYFEMPAFASVWNENCCFAYAVVNEDEGEVTYVYLQLIEDGDLTISDYAVPKNYEMEMETTKEK